MLLIGAFVLCVVGWAGFGLLSNGDRRQVQLPLSRKPEPNYLKAWRERPSTSREIMFGLLSFACLLGMMGLIWFAQTETCKADPTKCGRGKVERTIPLPPEDAGLPEDRPGN